MCPIRCGRPRKKATKECLTPLAGDPAGAGGYAGPKVKLSYKIELVEKHNHRVAKLNSGQW